MKKATQQFNVTVVFHEDEKANQLAFELAIRALLDIKNGDLQTLQNNK
jgi:hypothetical protein